MNSPTIAKLNEFKPENLYAVTYRDSRFAAAGNSQAFSIKELGMLKIKRVKRNYCKCGCGGLASSGRWFINHHHGRVESIETKQKRIKSLKENWAKDEKRKQNVRDRNKYQWTLPNYRAEQIERLSKLHKGKAVPEEARMKMSISALGPNNPNWRGGIACGPYCPIFYDKEFREMIDERDGNECLNPLCWHTTDHCPLEFHHINYNKKDCHPSNVLKICKSCNSRANFNKEFWQEHYKEIIRKRGLIAA